MNVRTAKLFRALMNNGYIEKESDEELFSYDCFLLGTL